MATKQIEIPAKLIPVFDGPADVRGAYGGRGSGKTRSFATMLCIKGRIYGEAGQKGIMLCARQFMNSLSDSSLEEIKRAIEDDPWLLDYYEIGQNYVRSKDGRIDFVFVGLDRNIASVKSKGRILICWVDEAEPVTDEAWLTLIPTLREEGEDWNAELWVTWNPKRKKAPVEKRFRFANDPLIKVVQLNHRDNPKFPAKLERERQRDLAERPDQYEHTWEGDYVGAVEGAYYAKSITQAKAEHRIGRVGPDPLMSYRAFCDIGGTGQKADAFTIWVAQFIGRELRALKYYEAVGQPASAHMDWLRTNGYVGGNTTIWLPHDGDKQDAVFDVSYRKAFEGAGYPVEVVPNQGKGAAMMRVRSGQRVWPSIYMDEEGCQAGLEAVGWYHENRDEQREIGLGPEHDWSSHGCLIAGTLITTARGDIPIESVEVGDFVLTPAGYAEVLNSGMTKISCELMEVHTESGAVLTLTPEHKVFTTNGIVHADSLSYNHGLYSYESSPCLSFQKIKSAGYRGAFIESFKAQDTGFGKLAGFMARKSVAFKDFCTLRFTGLFMESQNSRQKSLALMATSQTQVPITGSLSERQTTASIGFKRLMGYAFTTSQRAITKQTTYDMAALPCTVMYGPNTMGLFQTVCMFTTKMAIKATTILKTLSCSRLLSTQDTTEKQVLGSEAKQTDYRSENQANWLRLGIPANRVKHGILKMLSRLGKSVNGTQQYADNAAQTTQRHIRSDQNTAIKIAKLKRFETKLPVYDLTVKHHHCYFANGVLVSNCDSFGLMCVVFEAVGASRQIAKPIQYRRKFVT